MAMHVHAQGQRTAAAQASEYCTFDTDSYRCVVVGDGGEQVLGSMVTGSTIDGHGTLGGSRRAFGYWIKRHCASSAQKPEATKASGGQHRCVYFTIADLPQASFDIAT